MRLENVLQRCRQANLKLSKKSFYSSEPAYHSLGSVMILSLLLHQSNDKMTAFHSIHNLYSACIYKLLVCGVLREVFGTNKLNRMD